jgi:hypothetical protein
MSLHKAIPHGYTNISLCGRTEVDGKFFYFGFPAIELHKNDHIDHFGFPTEKIPSNLLKTIDGDVHIIQTPDATLFHYLLRKQHDDPSKNIIYFQSKKAAEAVVGMLKGSGHLKTMSFLPLSKMSIPQKNIMDLKNFKKCPRYRVIFTTQKMIAAWMYGIDIKSKAYIQLTEPYDHGVTGESMFVGRDKLIDCVLDMYEKMGEGDAEKYLSDTHMTIFGGELESYTEHLFRMLDIDTNEGHPSEFATLACSEEYTFPNRYTGCTDITHNHDWNIGVEKRARDVEEEEGRMIHTGKKRVE